MQRSSNDVRRQGALGWIRKRPNSFHAQPQAISIPDPEPRSKSAQSSHVDSIIKKDARQRRRELQVLVLGHNRSTLAKQLNNELGIALTAEQMSTHRKSIVKFVVTSMLAVIDHTFEQPNQQQRELHQYANNAEPDWVISSQIRQTALSLWNHPDVIHAFSQMNQSCVTALYVHLSKCSSLTCPASSDRSIEFSPHITHQTWSTS